MILAAFAHLISQEEKQLVDDDQMIRFRRIRNILALLTIVVLFSLAAPWDWFFLGVHVRLLIWYVPIVMFWFNRLTNARIGGIATKPMATKSPIISPDLESGTPSILSP